MTDPVTSSWPMPLRIASLAAIVGVSGWLIWQTQAQSNPPAIATPSGVAVPPPPAAASSATSNIAPQSPRAEAPAALPAATAALPPAPGTAPSAEAAAPPPPTVQPPAVVEAPNEPEGAPGGNAAKPTYFHSSKAMVFSRETLLPPKEPEVAAPPELIGRNPVFLHSSKAMMPTSLPSLPAPDAASAPDTAEPQAKPPEPIYIPSSKFADPAIFERLVEDEPAPSPQQQQQR